MTEEQKQDLIARTNKALDMPLMTNFQTLIAVENQVATLLRQGVMSGFYKPHCVWCVWKPRVFFHPEEPDTVVVNVIEIDEHGNEKVVMGDI